jgi:hypothetical protein
VTALDPAFSRFASILHNLAHRLILGDVATDRKMKDRNMGGRARSRRNIFLSPIFLSCSRRNRRVGGRMIGELRGWSLWPREDTTYPLLNLQPVAIG